MVGLDGESNLFRATDLYHTRRRYSWVDVEAKRIDMARPLGAFLYFPDEEPRTDEGSRIVGRYALTTGSFRLRAEDPLAIVRDLPELLRWTLIANPDRMGCHQLRETGGQAFHIRADDGLETAGYALALERYPAIVWKRFIYDQPAVAKEVGASAIAFEPGVAQSLYDLLVAEKKRRVIDRWIYPERERFPVPGMQGEFASDP